jgi:hypothetical protein
MGCVIRRPVVMARSIPSIRVKLDSLSCSTFGLNHELQQQCHLHTMCHLPVPFEQLQTTSSHSASQIPRLLWNPKVHYRVHNSPPLVPVLSQINRVDNFLTYFPKIRSNIILPIYAPAFQVVSSLPTKIFLSIYNISYTYYYYLPRSSHCSSFHHPNNIWSSSLWSFIQPPS